MAETTAPAESGSGLSRRSFLAGGAVAVGAIGLGLAGCSSSSGNNSGSTNQTGFSSGPKSGGTPVKGGTLRVGCVTGGAAETISILTGGYNPGDQIRIYNLYDPLFFVGPGGSVVPGLAQSAEPNADATVWTLHLRPGVTFHSGKTLDADDVVYTIQHSWANPKNVYNSVLVNIVDFANVKKIDQNTVQVPLKVAVGQFPTIFAIANAYVVQAGTKNFADGNGTGPFKLVSFVPGSRSEFSANHNYWGGGGPYVDSLVVDSSFTQENALINSLLANDLDIVPAVPSALAAANSRSGKIVLGNEAGPLFVGAQMRVDKGPFVDPRIRRAMKLLLDRPQMVTAVYEGYAVVGNDCAGQTDQYWASDLKIERDVAQAKSLLKAAGQENLAVTLATSDIFPGLSSMSVLIKQQAAAGGVNVTLNQIPSANYFTSAAGFQTRPFSMTYFNAGVNSLSIFYLTAMTQGAVYNETYWGYNPANQAMVYDAVAQVDTAKAQEKWHTLQQDMVDSGPYLIPTAGNWLDAYSPNVRGVATTSAMNCNNFNFTNAWLA